MVEVDIGLRRATVVLEAGRRSVSRVTLLVLLAACALRPSASAQPFAECEELTDSGFREAARCLFDTAKREALWDDAARKLEELRTQHRDSPWPSFYLGHVLYSRDWRRAEAMYREALAMANGLDAGATEARVEAGLALTRYLANDGRLDEADRELADAVHAAENGGDPVLVARVRIRQAYQDYYRGRQLHRTYHLLRRVCNEIQRHGPKDLDRQCLDAMYLVSYVLGRFRESRSFQERLLDLARESGNLPDEAIARFELAVVHIESERPGREARRKTGELLQAALATAERADYPLIEARSHLLLGKLEGGGDGRQHLQICLDLAQDLGDPELRNDCLGALAANLLREEPDKALELIEEVIGAAAESSDPWASIYGWEDRLPIYWETLPRSEAIGRSRSLLDRFEALRELQISGSGRADLLSAWAEIYYWISGRLLREAVSSEAAFEVTERMRAQVLLEALDVARAALPQALDDPSRAQLSAILERKIEIQRRLLDPALAGEARRAAVERLRSVESEEAELRYRIAEASPSRAPLIKPSLATLAEIEDQLEEEQALLSFQVGLDQDMYGWFAGGSWLQVSTRQGTQSYRLPEDRAVLEPAIDTVLDLTDLANAEKGLERLGRILLKEALGDLPSVVDRLVIVPDGVLHRLPFALLPSAEHGERLVARFEISVAPSATLWRRWRNRGPSAGETPVLVFAAPLVAQRLEAGAEPAGGAAVRGWAFADGAALPPLPYAREEGRAVVRALGGGSRLLAGEEATERFLKVNDLRRFAVIHFAAHAVIDEEVPERSAVLLAPGAEGEDGWLQPREIVELDLDGRVVVLASCNSAAGQVLRGEGVMSLARAFFQAGSPVVVASLWPLADDWTATIFKEFYRRLAAGASVAGALAGAQREMIRDRAPARAWAGLVALGDGDLVPFPGGLRRPPSRWWMAGVVVAVLAAALCAAVLLRR